MKLYIPFEYRQFYYPSKKHKKLRQRLLHDVACIEVREVEKMPVAFKVTEFGHRYPAKGETFESPEKLTRTTPGSSYDPPVEEVSGYITEPIGWSDGNCYRREREERYRYKAEGPMTIDSLKAYIAADYDRIGYDCAADIPFTEGVSIVHHDHKAAQIRQMEDNASVYVYSEGVIWSLIGEPMYEYNTFGLGHNHGGTGFFVTYHYNENISNKNYFPADKRQEAINAAVETAKRRGDTESVPFITDTMTNIEVLIPEAIKRNPVNDHGEGSPLLNAFEAVSETSGSALEAGVMAMAITAAGGM